MKSHVPTWNNFPRHETTFPEQIGPLKRIFFNFIFMSGRSNFTLFWTNCLFLPDMFLHFFSAQFTSLCRLFGYIFNAICFFWNEFVTKKPFPGSYCQRGTRLWAFFARSHGGLVREVALFLLKITLKTALCLCLKTLCAGFLLKITLKQLCACV